MTPKAYFWVTGIIFSLISLLHLARLLYGWDVTVEGTKVPPGVNVGGLLIAGYLAFVGVRLGRR